MTTYQERYTARELADAQAALQKAVGIQHHIGITFSTNPQNPAVVSVFTRLEYRSVYRAEAKSFGEAIARTLDWIETNTAERAQERIKKMALAIIETAFFAGEVDAQVLCDHGFTKDEVVQLHLPACSLAGQMAGCAPYTVVGLES